MARDVSGTEANRASGLFAAAFVLLLVVLALLGHFGLPDAALGLLFCGSVTAALILAAFSTRTMDASTFFNANRKITAPGNGMAGAAAFISGNVFLGLAGAYYLDASAALALTFGWSIGFLMMAVLIAPYFRRSGAIGVAGFLAIRFGGKIIRLAAIAIIVLSLGIALTGVLSAAAEVARLQFAMSPSTTLWLSVAVIAITTVLGGMRSLTVVGILQYIALAIAFLVPAILISATRASIPIPQLGFGFALQDAAIIVESTGEDLAPALGGRFLPAAPSGVINFMLTIASLAAGVVALPHLIMRAGTVADADLARRSVGWMLVFILIVALTAPAYAAFARLGLLTGLAGQSLGELPAWVFELGRDGLIQACGEDAASRLATIAACEPTGNAAAPLRASGIAFSTDAVVLAWPSILGLPQIVTVLLSLGALAALIAAASAMTTAIAYALGHDLFGRIVALKASAGRRLIASRIALIAVPATAAWLASGAPDQAMALGAASITLSAGGLFPVLVLAVWWRRTNVTGAIAGMLAGFAVTALILLQHHYPNMMGLDVIDPTRIGITILAAGLIGMAVGFAVAAGLSVITPRPTPKRLAVLDAIRRPGGGPIVTDERD